MKTRRSTRQALHAAIEMAIAQARAGDSGQVTAAEVAARHGLPPAVVAKILQRLARAELAVGSRGVTGGYRLARPAAEVTLLELFDTFERIGAEPRAGRRTPIPDAERRLDRLFSEIDEQVRATLASVTLETLVEPRRAIAS